MTTQHQDLQLRSRSSLRYVAKALVSLLLGAKAIAGAKLPRKLLGYFGMGLASVGFFGFLLSMELLGIVISAVAVVIGLGLLSLASGASLPAKRTQMSSPSTDR